MSADTIIKPDKETKRKPSRETTSFLITHLFLLERRSSSLRRIDAW